MVELRDATALTAADLDGTELLPAAEAAPGTGLRKLPLSEVKTFVLDGFEGGGGGSFPEAPIDGKTYGRKDGEWAEVVAGSGGGGGSAPVEATTEDLALLTARLTDTTQNLQVGFVKINLSVTSDISGGWDASDSSFLIAEDGDYLCIGLVRVADDSPLASHGVGIGTVAGDNANFLWSNTNTGLPTENRNGLLNTFIRRFSKGDRVFLFGYGGTVLPLSQAALSIKRLPSSVVTAVSGGGGGGSGGATTSWAAGDFDRSAIYTISKAGNVNGNPQDWLLTDRNRGDVYFQGNTPAEMVVDCKEPVLVQGWSLSQDGNQQNGVWTIAGSSDGVAWTDLVTDYVLGGVPYLDDLQLPNERNRYSRTFSNNVRYRYYRMKLNDGATTSSGPYVRHLVMKQEGLGGGAAGGGGSSPSWLTPPKAANFKLASGDGTPLIIADDPDLGLIFDGGITPQNDVLRYAYVDIPDKTKSWSCEAKLEVEMLNINYNGYGLGVFDIAANRMIQLKRDEGGLRRARWVGLGAYEANDATLPMTNFAGFFRIDFDAANNRYRYYISRNGKQWTIVGEGAAIAADRVGFFAHNNTYNNSPAGNYKIQGTVPHFKFVQ